MSNRKTTSFKINDVVKKEFQINCLKNNISMSEVIEKFMHLYNISSDGSSIDDVTFDIIYNNLNK